MRAVLIDDERMALEVLENQLLDIGGIEIIGTFTDPSQALKELKETQVDIVFLDMEMPKIHGLILAEEIQSTIGNLEIVFVTAHPEFAIEAFEVDAIDYLLKPVMPHRLEKTMERIGARIKNYKSSAILNQEVTIQALGNFQVVDANGQIVKWRTRKVKELFAYLWAFQNDPRMKDSLLEDLWTDYPVEKANRSMHTAVYQLRQTLKKLGFQDPIITVNNQYRLTITPNSDVAQLLESLDKPHPDGRDVEKNLQRYRGDFMEMESYHWAFDKQQNIRRKFLAYLENFIKQEKNKTNFEFIVEQSLEKMLQLDPYEENYLYLLLKHYGETGKLSKMLQHFETSQRNWKTELGLELPAEVITLYDTYFKN